MQYSNPFKCFSSWTSCDSKARPVQETLHLKESSKRHSRKPTAVYTLTWQHAFLLLIWDFFIKFTAQRIKYCFGFFLFLDFCLMLQSMMGTFLLCKTILCYLESTKGTTCKNGMYLIHIGVFQCKKQYICKGMKYVYNRNTVIPKWKRV